MKSLVVLKAVGYDANLFSGNWYLKLIVYTPGSTLWSTPGFILGQLLFVLYINDIQYTVGADCARLFADDMALYMDNTDLQVLISIVKLKVEQLVKWCISNKLTINSDKTYFVFFHTVNKLLHHKWR